MRDTSEQTQTWDPCLPYRGSHCSRAPAPAPAPANTSQPISKCFILLSGPTGTTDRETIPTTHCTSTTPTGRQVKQLRFNRGGGGVVFFAYHVGPEACSRPAQQSTATRAAYPYYPATSPGPASANPTSGPKALIGRMVIGSNIR